MPTGKKMKENKYTKKEIIKCFQFLKPNGDELEEKFAQNGLLIFEAVEKAISEYKTLNEKDTL